MPRLIARIDLKLTKPGMNDVLYVGGRGARRSAQSTRFGPGRAHPRRCSRRELWSWPIRNRRCRSGGFFFQNLRAPFSFCSSLMFEPKNRPVEKKNKREKIENFGTVWSFFLKKRNAAILFQEAEPDEREPRLAVQEDFDLSSPATDSVESESDSPPDYTAPAPPTVRKLNCHAYRIPEP